MISASFVNCLTDAKSIWSFNSIQWIYVPSFSLNEDNFPTNWHSRNFIHDNKNFQTIPCKEEEQQASEGSLRSTGSTSTYYGYRTLLVRKVKSRRVKRRKKVTYPPSPVGYTINLVYHSFVSDSQKKAFEAARRTWEKIIVKDLPGYYEPSSSVLYCQNDRWNFFGYIFPPNTRIDDLTIIVSVQTLDGVLGGTVASSGICGELNGKPRIGVLLVDSMDVVDLETNGLLTKVLLHEFAHILGIGSLWDTNKLISNSGTAAPATGQLPLIYYRGKQGNIGNVEVGGTGKALVENVGGVGTARGHWKESVYKTELLTSRIERTENMPLSRLTIRSLRDLGYPKLNLTLADPYIIPKPQSIDNQNNDKLEQSNDIRQIDLSDDMLYLTIYKLKGRAKAGREGEFEREASNYKKRKFRLGL